MSPEDLFDRRFQMLIAGRGRPHWMILQPERAVLPTGSPSFVSPALLSNPRTPCRRSRETTCTWTHDAKSLDVLAPANKARAAHRGPGPFVWRCSGPANQSPGTAAGGPASAAEPCSKQIMSGLQAVRLKGQECISDNVRRTKGCGPPRWTKGARVPPAARRPDGVEAPRPSVTQISAGPGPSVAQNRGGPRLEDAAAVRRAVDAAISGASPASRGGRCLQMVVSVLRPVRFPSRRDLPNLPREMGAAVPVRVTDGRPGPPPRCISRHDVRQGAGGLQ